MAKLQELYRLQQLDRKISRIEEELDSRDLLAEQEEVKIEIAELKDKLAANKEKEKELNKNLRIKSLMIAGWKHS